MSDTPPEVDIELVVSSRFATRDGNFIVYKTLNEPFQINTNLVDYADDIRAPLDGILTYINSEAAAGNQPELRYSIRLENTTAPGPPAGAWVQAKHHIDRALTYQDLLGLSSSPSLATPLLYAYPHHTHLEDFMLADIQLCMDFANYTIWQP